jgi:protease I
MISAGFMSGLRATSAWSMLDDLRAVGCRVDPIERAVRDGNVITAIFPQDLPAFWQLTLRAFADIEGRDLPSGYPNRLRGKRLAIAIDEATDSVQTYYLRHRIEEEGGQALLVGRKAGETLNLGAPPWEWGEQGVQVTTDAALPNPRVVTSCDGEAEANSHAVKAEQLDGLLLPGGLGTWMIRGHAGLHQLIREMLAAGKLVGAIGRGPKILLSAGVLEGRSVTCAPKMRDDLLYAGIDVDDARLVRDGNLLTVMGTEQLPAFVRAMLEMLS